MDVLGVEFVPVAEVWVVGSSYVVKAEDFINNGYRFTAPVSVHWIGRSGLKLAQVLPLVREEVRSRGITPNWMVLKVGGNDVVSLGTYTWPRVLREILDELQRLLPNTVVVWSDMFPRSCWKDVVSIPAAERSRKYLQRKARLLVSQHGGLVLRHQACN